MPQDIIDDISLPEALVCVALPIQCRSAYVAAKKAREWSLQNAAQDSGEEDGQKDGYRHVFWLSRMANKLGPAAASIFGGAHEAGHPGSLRANEMDRLNNKFGVQLASSGFPNGMGYPSGEAEIWMIGELILNADSQCKIVYYGPGLCTNR